MMYHFNYLAMIYDRVTSKLHVCVAVLQAHNYTLQASGVASVIEDHSPGGKRGLT
jgi:hypothetical protein